jgi:hypothetical protein
MTVTHRWGLARIMLPRYVSKVLHVLSRVRVIRLSTHDGYADSSELELVPAQNFSFFLIRHQLVSQLTLTYAAL